MLCLNAPARPLIPQVSETLIQCLLNKRDFGRPVAPVWRRLVRDEIQRAAANVDCLTPRERDDAARLLDWYVAAFADDCDEAWFTIYRSDQRERRSWRAIFFYYSRHVDELTPLERNRLIEVLDDYFNTHGEFYSVWSALYW